MNRVRALMAFSTMVLALLQSSAVGGPVIPDFTNNWNNINNWPGQNDLEKTTNRDNATANVNQAAINWSTAIFANLPVVVSVDIAPIVNPGPYEVGDLCAVGGVTATQNIPHTVPTAGSITLNKNYVMNGIAANTLFIDPTPATHEEFIAVAGKPWLGTANPNGPAFGKDDLQTCIKHEFGHVMGFHNDPNNVGGFTPYHNAINAMGPPGPIPGIPAGYLPMRDFLVNGLPDVFGMPVGALNDLNASSHWDPNVQVPANFFQQGSVQLDCHDLLMCPTFLSSRRVSMSPLDVSGAAYVQGLPQGFGYNLFPKGLIPEPSTAALLALAGPLVLRRRR